MTWDLMLNNLWISLLIEGVLCMIFNMLRISWLIEGVLCMMMDGVKLWSMGKIFEGDWLIQIVLSKGINDGISATLFPWMLLIINIERGTIGRGSELHLMDKLVLSLPVELES